MKKVLMALMAVGVVCAVGSAEAKKDAKAPATTSLSKGQAKLDTNKDGKLSKEECAARAPLAKVFVKKDINKDGFLTPNELVKKKKKK